ILTALRRRRDAQLLEKLRRHRRPFGMRSERLPEQDIGVGFRRHAPAQPFVEGGGKVRVAVLVERFGNIGRVLADGELPLAFLPRVVLLVVSPWAGRGWGVDAGVRRRGFGPPRGG